MLKIAYYTAVDANLTIFSNAYSRVDTNKVSLKVFHRRSFSSGRVRQQLIDYLEEADILLIQLMGGKISMPEFDHILSSNLSGAKVYIYGTTAVVHELAEEYNTVDDKIALQLFQFFAHGGEENILQMFNYLRGVLKKENITYKQASELPMEGIYHPKHGYFKDFDSYKHLLKQNQMTVGITFYRNYYLNNDHVFLDDLVETLERKGINVIAIFLTTVKNNLIKNISATDVLKAFMVDENDNSRVDVLINLLMFSNCVLASDSKKYLDVLDIPVLQGILVTENYETWQEENHGLTASALTINVALPEMDGSIITIAIATKEICYNKITGIDIVSYKSIPERINRLSNLAINFAILRKKPNSDKKIAILMHNYPPKNEAIGCAFGLDTQKSILNILESLKKAGYKIEKNYKDSSAFMDEILSVATNDESWNSTEQKKKSHQLPESIYKEFYNKLHLENKILIKNQWGDAPGTLMVYQNNNKRSLLIPGIENGNIFIGIQPQRDQMMAASTAYHNPDLSINHSYYGYYQWLKHVFKADAVIHVGKHGSLEWLPGKAVALSEKCDADIAIQDLPNFYPYIINNPGEGTQAKRRSHAALIGHLEPAMTDADIYDDFAELENLVDDFIDDESFGRKISEVMIEQFKKLLDTTGLSLDFNDIIDIKDKLKAVHNYLEEMKESLINNGLHVFGECPEQEDLIQFICALTRIESPGIPSLDDVMAKALGFDIDYIYNIRKVGSLLQKQEAAKQIKKIRDASNHFVKLLLNHESLELFYNENNISHFEILEEISVAILNVLIPNLKDTKNELIHLVGGLEGRFIPPGPSGAPTRGQTDILPTGRNFYTLNPNAIPTKAAWEIGVKLGQVTLDRFLLEHNGKYPENIGFALFGSPTIRTKGEDVAQIMYLLGVKPVWQKGSANVKGIEIIPLEILGRPRIDLTIRITGFFRDAFLKVVELIDEAVMLLSQVDEPLEMNYIKKHVIADTQKFIDQGEDDISALRKSAYRIFGAKPGAYGTGINTLINGKDWKNTEDIADMYTNYGGYAYGKENFGVPSKALFKERLTHIELAIKNIDTKETDVLANDDNYAYLGGMVAAASTYRTSPIQGYVGDTSDPSRIKVRDIKEATRFVLRTKVLNPKWYNSLKKHGFRGANEISSAVDYTFGWDATTQVIDDLTYEKITEAFVKNEELSKWMKQANPWAMQNIIERMLEAIQRGLWQASDEMKEYLTEEYIKNEGVLEGRSDEATDVN